MAEINHPSDLFNLYAQIMIKFPDKVKKIDKVYLFNFIGNGDDGTYCWTVDCSKLTVESKMTDNADFGIEISYNDFMTLLEKDTNYAMQLWYDGLLRVVGNKDHAMGIVQLNELVNKL